jgi:hypothetical protein
MHCLRPLMAINFHEPTASECTKKEMAGRHEGRPAWEAQLEGEGATQLNDSSKAGTLIGGTARAEVVILNSGIE